MRPHSRRLAIGLVAAGMVLTTTSAAHAEPQGKEQPTTTGRGQLVGESPYPGGTCAVPADDEYRVVVARPGRTT